MLTDSFLSQLRFYENQLRQTGRTTRCIEEAKRLDAYFVCHNMAFAQDLKRNHPDLKVVTLDQYLNDEFRRGRKYHFRYGSERPKVIFDHLIEYVLLERKLKEVESILNREI